MNLGYRELIGYGLYAERWANRLATPAEPSTPTGIPFLDAVADRLQTSVRL